MDPAEQAKFDQAAAFMADALPSLLRRMFDACVEQGFIEDQSLKLVQTYILSLSVGGVRGI